MQPFTLKQAVEQSKKAKTTILDAIKSGRLSATKDENGRYQIDPAELFRVYQPTTERRTDKEITDHADREILELKLKHSQELLELERRLNSEREANNEMARRLENIESKLTLLLTHQKEKPPQQSKNDLWEKVFKRNKT